MYVRNAIFLAITLLESYNKLKTMDKLNFSWCSHYELNWIDRFLGKIVTSLLLRFITLEVMSMLKILNTQCEQKVFQLNSRSKEAEGRQISKWKVLLKK